LKQLRRLPALQLSARCGTTGGTLTLVNPQVSNDTVSFDITCSAGQTFTILSATNLTLAPAQWTALLTANSPGTNVHFADPRPATSGRCSIRRGMRVEAGRTNCSTTGVSI
jgi:hypothetical protein